MSSPRSTAALLLVAASLCGEARDAAACCLPRRVTDHRWNALAPADVGFTFATPVADASAGVYSLTNAADGTLVLLASRDDGMTFEEVPIPTSGVRTAAQAGLAAFGTADLVVAWTDADDHVLHVIASHDQGRTFDPPTILASEPVLALGSVAVVPTTAGFALSWQRAASVLAVPQELFVVASRDAGRTWGAPVRIDDSGIGLQGKAALSASGDDVVASWLEGNPATVTADHSGDGGASWSSDAWIGRAVLGHPTRIAASGTGVFAILTVQDGATGSLQVSSSIDSGRTWSGVGFVAAASGLGGIVAMPDGRVPVVYTAPGAAGLWDTWLTVSFDRGLPGTFQPPELLLAGALRTDDFHLTRGADGKPWLVQGDYRDFGTCPVPTTCESVYISPGCKVLGEGLPPTLRVDEDLPPNLSHSEDGKIVISASGRIHVFWTDFGDDGTAQIRHACYDQPPDALPVDFELPGLLSVAKDAGSVRLAWTDSRSEATHYDVLEGSIAGLNVGRAYDHAGNPCSHPRSGPGAPATSYDAPMPSIDTYWLIAPTSCAGTGAAGFDSFGVPTPPAGTGAACGPP